MAHIGTNIYHRPSVPTAALDKRRWWLGLVQQGCRKVDRFELYLRCADVLNLGAEGKRTI